jgi:1-acyl-sn-glycerol-3-phosphate acyltransferase
MSRLDGSIAEVLRAPEGSGTGAFFELEGTISSGGRLYPEGWALVQAHRRQGHTVVLASSATRDEAEPTARELGVDHVLCTEAGHPKARAARELATSQRVDMERSFAYAHGFEDLPLLEAVGRPRPINPEPRLADVAARRGWPTRSFDSRARPGVVEVIRTAASYGGLFTGFGIGFGLGLMNGSRRQGVDLGLTFAGEASLALAGIEVDVQGAEHLWSHRPAVFIINHQSPIDVPVMCKLLRSGFSGVAKKEVARSPFGPVFALADVAFVDRTNTAQAKAALRPAVERLRQGISLAIAPEGTRSASPRLGAFKKGAFHVAMQAGVPIVPVVLRNAGEAMGRDAKTMRATCIDVYVHPPVDVGGWSTDELDERVEEVRDLYLATLERWPERRRSRAGER